MKLKEKLLALQKAMQSIIETAKAEDREITADEASELEAKGAEALELKTRIDRKSVV